MPANRVCIVDDDPGVMHLTSTILEETGEFRCEQYSSGEDLFARANLSGVSCVLSDLRLPNMDGLELQRILRQKDPCITLVVMTGFADIATAVKLIRRGATNLLQKPYDTAELIVAVREAVTRTLRMREQWSRLEAAKANYDSLTDEERDVVRLLVNGVPNKAIPTQLCMSSRTFDRRKHSAMLRMQVASVVDLATLMARIASFDAMRAIDHFEKLENFPLSSDLLLGPASMRHSDNAVAAETVKSL
jgi:two-component system, LuxR family, response regulator FixJ